YKTVFGSSGFNRDGLSFRKRDSYSSLRGFCHRRGVGDFSAFIDRVIGCLSIGSGIDLFFVRRFSWRRFGCHVFDVGAFSFGDRRVDFRAVVIVVVCRILENHLASGFSGFNRDGLA
ncbi:hypothetical protein HX838_29925, partial [Pseudomonas tolaasii]